jgi:hypothetical protein
MGRNGVKEGVGEGRLPHAEMTHLVSTTPEMIGSIPPCCNSKVKDRLKVRIALQTLLKWRFEIGKDVEACLWN